MEPTGVDLVNVGVWLGLLRWLTLGILIAATFIFLKKDRNEGKSKRGLAMLIITIIAMPFLILEITYKNNTEDTNTPEEIAEVEPTKKPVIDVDDIPTIEPANGSDERENNAPTNSGDEYTPIVRPSRKPKEAPKEERNTNPESQDQKEDEGSETDPDAPTVTYKVIHRKMNIYGTDYEIADTETASGKAGTKVTPATKSYTGFTAPTAAQVSLPDNNDLEITLDYTRNKYQYTVNSGSVNSSLPSDEYYYETPITVTANAIAGYTFASWNDGSTDNPHSFTLTGKTTIEPIYNPNTDTHYQVSHQKKNLNDSNYTEANLDDGYGTTGTEITPPVRSYTGFKTPSTQTVIIAGDGSTRVVYKYDREQYSYSYGNSEYVESSKTAGNYDYETPITLKAKNRAGYRFTGWSNGSTNQEITITLTGDTAITPEYTANTNTPYMVRHRKMNADGSSYTEEEDPKTGTTDTEVTPATKSYAGYTAPNTQTITISGEGNTEVIYEYTPNTYNIVFNANGGTGDMAVQLVKYDNPANLNANSFTRTHYQFKHWNTADNDTGTSYTDGQEVTNLAEIGDVTLYAIWEADSYTITFDKNNANATGAMGNQTVKFDSTFNLSANAYSLTYYNFVGWARSATATEADFADEAEISTNLTENSSITLYAVWADTRIWRTVEFDANGGTTVGDMTVENGTNISPLPTTTYTDHAFYGWWTEDGTTELTTNTSITDNIKFVAHWKLDIEQAVVSPQTINVVRDQTETLTITNSSDVESYTMTSSNESIATVDENGVVTGKADGQTTIIITGEKTGKTISVEVNVTLPTYTVSFDAGDGECATSELNVDAGNTIAEADIPTATKEYYDFIGWFTQPEGGEQLTSATEISASITYYAHYTPKLICKAATELHTKTCPTTGSCNDYKTNPNVRGGVISPEGDNYSISYGYLPNSHSPQKPGEAYDCDVNGDGEYDLETERFYYLNNVDDNVVRLSYYSGYNIDKPDERNNWVYDTAVTKLPSNELWKNDLVPYSDGKKAKFPVLSDVLTACNLTESNMSTVGSIKSCIFLIENTAFDGGSRSAIWLEKESPMRRIHAKKTSNMNIATLPTAEETTSKNTVRPVIQVRLENIEKIAPIMHTVTFNTLGGSDVDPITDEKGEAIELPSATKVGFSLSGWSTTEDGNSPVGNAGSQYTIENDVTLYAIWGERNSTAYVEGDGEEGYTTTLQKAIDRVPTTGVHKKIHLLKDTTEGLTVSAGQDIEFDLGGHTVTNDNKVISNNGRVLLTNGTIKCTAGANGAINNENTGTVLIIDGATIEATDQSQRQAVWNNGGRLEITGNSVLSSVYSKRATVHNLNNGTTIITSGTITSTGAYAVYNESGSLTIGSKDGVINTAAPTIQGQTYGVIAKNNNPYNFYDGTISGKTYATGRTSNGGKEPTVVTDTNETMIGEIEINSQKFNDEQGGYKILYLIEDTTKHLISFDANGGTSSEAQRSINDGDQIGTLPTADRTHYSFLGWFTERTGGTEISASTVPDGNITYYAHWQAQSSDQIVDVDIQHEAVTDYYSSIASWDSTGVDTALWAKLKMNFESYNCKANTNNDISTDWENDGEFSAYNYYGGANSGTYYCDRPYGYDTEIADGINVYLSNDQKEKLSQVNYLDTTNGVIKNMIPDTIYRWESTNDPDLYGYIRANGDRRMISLPNTRNVRDLGGLIGQDGKKIKYGRLIRGEWIQTNDDIAVLQQLGINKEYDLRKNSEITGASISGKHFSDSTSDYWHEVIHYDFDNGTSNYATTRSALTSLMHDIVDDHKNIYFHCTHGADRTGTLAWLIESLLGVDLETRNRDYELTSISGRPDRTRYYTHKKGGQNGEHKYVFMMGWMNTNYSYNAYDWYMAGSTDVDADNALINAFRQEMLE